MRDPRDMSTDIGALGSQNLYSALFVFNDIKQPEMSNEKMAILSKTVTFLHAFKVLESPKTRD